MTFLILRFNILAPFWSLLSEYDSYDMNHKIWLKGLVIFWMQTNLKLTLKFYPTHHILWAYCNFSRWTHSIAVLGGSSRSRFWFCQNPLSLKFSSPSPPSWYPAESVRRPLTLRNSKTDNWAFVSTSSTKKILNLLNVFTSLALSRGEALFLWPYQNIFRKNYHFKDYQ